MVERLQSDSLTLTWYERQIKGYVDVFSHDEFDADCSGLKRTHLVRSPDGSLEAATYYLAVHGDTAVLDYAAFPAENTRAGMDLGKMRIKFRDARRSQVAAVTWADGSSDRFTRAKVKPSTEPAFTLSEYRPRRGDEARRTQRVKERLGQAKFRARLMLAYGSTCCMSGCTVSAALDGAHIDAYLNPSHDHPRNGLLLRKDLHCLFDSHLLSIDPDGGVIVIAEVARVYPAYARLHGGLVKRPIQGFEPDISALRRHFQAYKEQGSDRSASVHHTTHSLTDSECPRVR